jgi:restriction system protein
LLQAAARRNLLEWTTDLRLLSASEFEWLVGELLRREGWQVTETGREGEPDGNIDLRIVRHGQTRLVQCKRWDSRAVGVNEVRKLGGTLMREDLPGTSGTLVTLSSFNDQAIAEADAIGLELVDGRALLHRIEHVRRPELCPSCGTPMLLDRSAHGWWLRCPRWSGGCSGKRDLDSEPGRAVGLLLGV